MSTEKKGVGIWATSLSTGGLLYYWQVLQRLRVTHSKTGSQNKKELSQIFWPQYF